MNIYQCEITSQDKVVVATYMGVAPGKKEAQDMAWATLGCESVIPKNASIAITVLGPCHFDYDRGVALHTERLGVFNPKDKPQMCGLQD